MKRRPAFLITIDTEGDNLWSRPREITTYNASYLPRFQELCEKYSLFPTYLTNYEMANSDEFVEFGKDVISRNTAEIGMHLHAWNSPPEVGLTKDDYQYQPYLIEYPALQIKEKVYFLTILLEEKFQKKMLSHRAGRWSFNAYYARTLLENGYLVDCSVTPHVSWVIKAGNPAGKGGTNYEEYPERAYFVDPDDVSKVGGSTLLEIPMTIICHHRSKVIKMTEQIPLIRRLNRRYFPAVDWLRPDGKNLSRMKKIAKDAVTNERDYIEFMLHSSELMPGGSLTFSTEEQVERLFSDLESLFDSVKSNYEGMTLAGYYDRFTEEKSVLPQNLWVKFRARGPEQLPS